MTTLYDEYSQRSILPTFMQRLTAIVSSATVAYMTLNVSSESAIKTKTLFCFEKADSGMSVERRVCQKERGTFNPRPRA